MSIEAKLIEIILTLPYRKWAPDHKFYFIFFVGPNPALCKTKRKKTPYLEIGLLIYAMREKAS